MKTVYSDAHRLQDGKRELIDGQLQPCFETPRRADVVLSRVREVMLGEVLTPRDFGLAPIGRVHAADFIAFLEDAWTLWAHEHGDRDALPLSWPARGMRAIEPEAIDGRLGYFCFDAGTPITSGTWQAITAAANVALTGQALVAGGERGAFALCRPPGHHAGSDFYGGYCFLNNAAIAAQALRDGGAARVAVLDVDYHHGNGTQEIFYARDDVLTVSIHADPRQEYPYFLGHADETGSGPGAGFHLNLPLRWGTGWELYEGALAVALAKVIGYGPDAVVVSLGVDTFEKDPISRFKLRQDDYVRLGAALAGTGRPTLFVMEGGYALDELGVNVVNVLTGFEQG